MPTIGEQLVLCARLQPAADDLVAAGRQRVTINSAIDVFT